MATIIKAPIKNIKKEVKKELEKFALPNRDPDKAKEELYGRREGRDISIEKIRANNNRKKW